MAEKKPAAAAAAAAPAAEKPKLPLVPIIGAAVGSAVLVGAIMFFMMPKAPAAAEGDEAHAEEAAEEAPVDPAAQTRYIEVKDPLVVNLSGGTAKYLQVKVQLSTKSDAGQKDIETHLPALQNALLAMLQQTTPEELAQPDVMTVLQGRALSQTNKLLEAETKKKDIVTGVIFTSFIKQ